MKDDSDRPVVLSVEQALSMSYATLRFVHEGFRVIRVEATPVPGRRAQGDPNRSIGRPVAGADRHSYFVGPNVGKEAIALDLKSEEGRALLHRLVRDLPVDVFCTNTLPARHARLGLDYDSLRGARPDLIWASISALGTEHPEVPGYDPVIQALCGYMDITGPADGPPTQNGPPLADLKAGDEVFAQVAMALYRRARTGEGARIDVSMAHGAASWLLTFLPMLDMGSPPEELRRNGNEHRQFIPTNAYPTADGYVYMAIGSDAQWARLVATEPFGPLAQPRFETNEGRRADRRELTELIEAITTGHRSREIAAALAKAGVPHAPITPIEGVMDLGFLAPRLLRTRAPDGREIRLPPPAVPTERLERSGGELPFAPAYGEHTARVLGEIGLSEGFIDDLRRRGVVA